MRHTQQEALSGRIALVTGATGSMGAAIAQRLAGGAMSAYPAPVIAEAKSDKKG